MKTDRTKMNKNFTDTSSQNRARVEESGNVLFLILIAVALFAALSYAVTQSTRSGAGSGDNETALINSAQLTQYPASVRTAVVRMVIGGTDVNNIEFNPPSDYGSLSDNSVGVFHPSGGGATFSTSPADFMDPTGLTLTSAQNLSTGEWAYNGENQIDLIGTTNTTAATDDTADIIAFLPGITQTLCRRINSELGITGIPDMTGQNIDYYSRMNGGSETGSVSGIRAGGGTGNIGDVTDTTANDPLDGQPFGCFVDTGTTPDTHVYYHVLVER